MTGWNRRQFLRNLALTSGAVAGGLALTACGGDDDDSTDSSTAPSTGSGGTQPATSGSAGGAGKTGTLTIGNSEGNPEHLDLLLTPAFVTRQNVGACHAFLVGLAVDNSLVPEVATEWEIVDDVTIKFTIRQGITFHHGRAIVASDVVKTYEHVLNPDTGSTFRDTLATALKSIEAPDDTTVIAHLTGPFPAFIALASQIPIYPMEVVEEQGDMRTNVVGAGPFVFKEWQKDNFCQLEAYDGYWDADVPAIATIRVLPRSDSNALRSGFVADETNVVFNYRFTDKQAIEDADGTAEQVKLYGFQFVVMNTTQPPFDNVALRQAVLKATDRAALAAAAQGPDTPVADILIPKSAPQYPTDIEPWALDVEGAKQLIDDNGLAGTEVKVLIVDLPFARPYGPVMQANLEAIGLKPGVDIRAVADFLDQVYTNKTYQLGLTGDASPPDPSLFLNRYLTSTGSTAVTNFANTELDELLAKAGTLYDDAERAALYLDAMKLVNEQAPAFPLFENVATTAYKKNVSGWGVKSNADFDVAKVTIS
ncbi:MAG: ABC transporter substrate-binding protein [Actinobacteria bacterium]|nr:ABC transporter substrate-binding protein [Actinomycetota bacterium]